MLAHRREEMTKMAGENIPWRHSLEEAQREARQQGKLVLIDMFNPG